MDLLLSIDLGPVNSSYTLMDINTERIIKWSLIHFVDNNKQTYEKVCTNMMLEFDKLELTKIPIADSQVSPTISTITIIIELQPKCNVKTTVMAGQMQMYFVIHKHKCLLTPQAQTNNYKP